RAPGHLLALALVRRRPRVRLRAARPPRGRAPHPRRAVVLRGAVRALPPPRGDGHLERGGSARVTEPRRRGHRLAVGRARGRYFRADAIRPSSRAQNSWRAVASARCGPRWSDAAGSRTTTSDLRRAPA